ncbi:monovalent cation/H+ antiporter complex subunit F [Desulfobacula toluolica]|uniref:MrpF: Na(+)/H(+) antiporter, subunit F (Multiple resistance and pH homeostasis protein F) n=1 Tax=Desulfobacula toluolica (strain DSM 7467 / Tol2) TaxID=651182 RepID=K0NHA4_DESTT|nr:cation:proton antiporter [Desulfobacula toluolica]CCK78382.1 MrpF: Na(+)/H(+) antiporter, subunit F (Multiple resistance and pH homeostasis protein F) [Desulfobacula toluolica Tol2]
MMTGNLFLTGACQAAMAMLLAALTMLLWRLAKGPVAADRVIAMDLMSVLVVAFLVILSIYTGETTYLDVAIAYACIAFLGTIALARFIHRRGRKNDLRLPPSTPGSPKGGPDD